MDLYIDTSNSKIIKISLKAGDEIVAGKEIPAFRRQSELLIPAVQAILKIAKAEPDSLANIYVTDTGDSFSALRIGVAAANALGYALGKPVQPVSTDKKSRGGKIFKFSVVSPRYSMPPNITIRKKVIK